jgi:hypothetical protein
MKSMQWVILLQPLLVLLVPLIISQGKKYLGTNAQWVIPASAPIIGALVDFLQSFATNTSLGPLQAAVYGGLGVWLRELYDQVKKSMPSQQGKSIIALLVIPLVSLGILTGCGAFMTPPVVKIPMAQAALTWGDFQYLRGVATLRLTDMCAQKKLTEVDCTWLKAEKEKLDMVDREIRKSLIAAKGEVDQEKVMQYLQILAGIAVKVGGL